MYYSGWLFLDIFADKIVKLKVFVFYVVSNLSVVLKVAILEVILSLEKEKGKGKWV